MAGLAALAVASPAALAQEPTRTPSPEELWEAYPLDPGATPPRATPSAEFGAAPTAVSTPAASSDGGGFPMVVVVVPAALALFAAGVLLGRRWRRDRAAEPVVMAPPPAPAPRRFDWRFYPPPARPAPPPPGSAPLVETSWPSAGASPPAAASRRAETSPSHAAAARAGPSSRAAASPSSAVSRRAAGSRSPAASPRGATSSRPATAVVDRSPWTRRAWRAQVVWDDGFKVLVLEPGRVSPAGAEGPDEDPELVDTLQNLQAALEAEGWTPAGRAEPWYGRRFVWQHPGRPPGQGGPK